MLYSFIKLSIVLTAIRASVSAQIRQQGGLCGDNGLDGIAGSVPACMFLAGTTVSPNANHSNQMKYC